MRRFSILLLAFLAVTAACRDANGPGDAEPIAGLPRSLSVAETQLITADNAFGLELFHVLDSTAGPDENLFLSPLSVAMALGMTYNGAAGETQVAMERTLGLTGLSRDDINRAYRGLIDLLGDLDPAVVFEIANSIWYRNGITLEPQFLDDNRQYFDATIEALDFANPNAASTINAWVRDRTRGRIEKIVDSPIPGDVILYLINAIYFNANWTYQFDPDRTAPRPFVLADGTEVMVPMMAQTEMIPVATALVEGVRILDLSYGGGAFRFTVALPDTPAGIHDLAANLTEEQWSDWVSALDSTEIIVQLPKFSLEQEYALRDPLEALGMIPAFCGTVADFARMYPEACISRVKHKTFVEVDEEGTEAAAVTSVEFVVTSAPPIFAVDRPFLFVLRERLSGTILFLGKVVDPR